MLSSTLQVSPSFYGTGESYLFTFFPFFKVCFILFICVQWPPCYLAENSKQHFIDYCYFACRVVSVWNSLPAECVHFSTLNSYRHFLFNIDMSQWPSGNMPDCGVRGPRFESHRRRLCLSRQPL